MPQDRKFTLWFDEIGIEDVPKVGEKNASLGEIYQELITKVSRFPMVLPPPRMLTGI